MEKGMRGMQVVMATVMVLREIFAG
jgi:hypothetical protein